MKMLLKKQREQLLKNHRESAETGLTNHYPVVKFFCPWGAGTWLISEMDEDGRMFGLCDPGLGTPEVGYVMFDEICSVRGPWNRAIERDMHWKPVKRLSEYADEARQLGRVAA